MAAKRSMAVRPHPVVLVNAAHARFPSSTERGAVWDEKFKSFMWPRGEPEWRGAWGYRITRVTNSVEFRPGMALSKVQVQKLIDDGWTVSVLSS